MNAVLLLSSLLLSMPGPTGRSVPVAAAAFPAALDVQAAAQSADAHNPGALFDEVTDVLQRRFYDKEARETLIPELARKLRPLAASSLSLEEERAVIGALLGALDVSHCALYSKRALQTMRAELLGFEYPTVGMQLRLDGEEHCVDWVYEGGPAARAGLLRGQIVETLDGLPVAASPLLDWRTDDAALPDAPLHALLVDRGQQVTVGLADGREVVLTAEKRNGMTSSKEGARILERDGLRLGYVHFWFIHARGPGALLGRLLREDFADCDALLLDLRGRGGSAAEVENVLRALADIPDDGPLVLALQDAGARSAKEVIAHEIRARELGTLVGEATAGAVIPASFENLSHDTVLMFPAFTLGRYTELLEGKPVEPDVYVEDDLRSAPDEILEGAIRVALERLRSAR